MKAMFLIPKDKFDCTTIESLLYANKDEVLSVKDELLEWIEDYNWPCAQAILNVMAKRFVDFKELFEYAFKQYENKQLGIGVIRSILYIYYLIDDNRKSVWKHYEAHLLRIKEYPAQDEIAEGIYDNVLEILEKTCG